MTTEPNQTTEAILADVYAHPESTTDEIAARTGRHEVIVAHTLALLLKHKRLRITNLTMPESEPIRWAIREERA